MTSEALKASRCGQMKSSIEDFSVSFKGTQFKAQYVRNNRGKGAKSLRCFPTHKTQGHVQRGFCGSGIHVQVTGNVHKNDVVLLQLMPRQISQHSHNEDMTGSSRNNYIKLAGPKEEDHLVVDIKRGGVYLHSDLDMYLKYKHANSKRINKQKLYIAYANTHNLTVLSSENSKITNFTALPKWWSYAWKSNKSSRVTEHIVRAYYMKSIDTPYQGSQHFYECKSIKDSSSFQIRSSKMEYNRKASSVKRPASNMSSSSAGKNKFQRHSNGTKRLKSIQANDPYSPVERNKEQCETDLIKAIMGDDDGNALFRTNRSAKDIFDEDLLFEAT